MTCCVITFTQVFNNLGSEGVSYGQLVPRGDMEVRMAHICHRARYLFPNPKLPWSRQGLRGSFQKNGTCHLKTFQSNSIQNKLPPTAKICGRPFGCKSLGWALGEVTEDKAFKNDKSQKTRTQLSTLRGGWSLSQWHLDSVLITRLNKIQHGTSLCSFILSLRDEDKL